MLNSVQIREAFHVHVLRELAAFGLSLRLKGGVNLRLFFGSNRYSEDMDLDADSRLVPTLQRKLPAVLRDRELHRRLLALGLEITEPTRAAKDTDTVLRYKLQVVQGGVAHPTKIEISYRASESAWAELAHPLPQVVAPYLEPGGSYPAVAHYVHRAAITQKVQALAKRSEVQARDVFDLAMLAEERHGSMDRVFLRRNLPGDVIKKATDRALEVGVAQFRDQVVSYLEPPLQQGYLAGWEGMQLSVAGFLETIQRTPTTDDEPTQ